jgi:hypothetical protein
MTRQLREQQRLFLSKITTTDLPNVNQADTPPVGLDKAFGKGFGPTLRSTIKRIEHPYKPKTPLILAAYQQKTNPSTMVLVHSTDDTDLVQSLVARLPILLEQNFLPIFDTSGWFLPRARDRAYENFSRHPKYPKYWVSNQLIRMAELLVGDTGGPNVEMDLSRNASTVKVAWSRRSLYKSGVPGSGLSVDTEAISQTRSVITMKSLDTPEAPNLAASNPTMASSLENADQQEPDPSPQKVTPSANSANTRNLSMASVAPSDILPGIIQATEDNDNMSVLSEDDQNSDKSNTQPLEEQKVPHPPPPPRSTKKRWPTRSQLKLPQSPMMNPRLPNRQIAQLLGSYRFGQERKIVSAHDHSILLNRNLLQVQQELVNNSQLANQAPPNPLTQQ